MESSESFPAPEYDPSMLKYLVGDLGIQIMGLVDQGCINDLEIIRYSAITQSCLDIKIPLLRMLKLMDSKNDAYRLTPNGDEFLKAVLRWDQ